MFTKIVTITPTYSGRGATDTFAVIYRGKADNGDAFNMVISEYCLREAKLVIGDGVDLSLVHDTKGKKWIMIDANVNGYRLVAAKSNGKGLSAAARGKFQRGIFKTSIIDPFLEKYFGQEKIRWDDDLAQIRVGQICFPLEHKQAWF